jgi:hypothetical protein
MAGVLRQEAADFGRNDAPPDIAWSADPDRTGQRLRTKADAGFKLLDLAQDLLGPFDQGTALFRQADRTCRAIQEDNAKMSLERSKPLGYRRRRKPDLATCGSQTAFLDDFQEQGDVVEQHSTAFPDYLSVFCRFIRFWQTTIVCPPQNKE